MTVRGEKAAKRAEILENLTDEEKEIFRKRKSYVGVCHAWRDYFSELTGEEAKELILAVIDYDSTGEVPQLSQGANRIIFKGFIKSFLDNLFNEWCLSCYQNMKNGGGKITAIKKLTVQKLNAKYGSDNIFGIRFSELLKKDNKESLLQLQKEAGERFEQYKQDIETTFQACKEEYELNTESE